MTISRKRCRASSTTANVVEHQAGALNIDGTRVRFQSAADQDSAFPGGRLTSRKVTGGGLGAGWRDHDRGAFAAEQSTLGRWPANVLLLHRPGCEQSGTAMVPGYTINRWTDGAKPFGGGAGHEYESDEQPAEEVAVWTCTQICAVQEIEVQSGVRTNTSHYSYKRSGGDFIDRIADAPERRCWRSETGTAARYFKQIQNKEEDMDELPQEMIDYLVTMISPPPACNPVILVRMSLDDYSWEQHEAASVHGIITMGNPGPHMEDIDRVLRPGAHLLVVSPEDEPTGHTGACAVEDFGYEIRDAIAVLDAPGDLHYVAKASSAERNAGVEARTKDNGRVVQNDHETVKPVAIMERLLADVPQGALVVDPFMGSGTTGIACLRTGHDFIGIDQEQQYLQIADQRIRHWDRATNAWKGATIESEAVFKEGTSVCLEDLFGFGGDNEETEQVGDCPVCEQRDTEMEIKQAGERIEVCSVCAEDREGVHRYLLKEARARVEELLEDLEE